MSLCAQGVQAPRMIGQCSSGSGSINPRRGRQPLTSSSVFSVQKRQQRARMHGLPVVLPGVTLLLLSMGNIRDFAYYTPRQGPTHKMLTFARTCSHQPVIARKCCRNDGEIRHVSNLLRWQYSTSPVASAGLRPRQLKVTRCAILCTSA